MYIERLCVNYIDYCTKKLGTIRKIKGEIICISIIIFRFESAEL